MYTCILKECSQNTQKKNNKKTTGINVCKYDDTIVIDFWILLNVVTKYNHHTRHQISCQCCMKGLIYLSCQVRCIAMHRVISITETRSNNQCVVKQQAAYSIDNSSLKSTIWSKRLRKQDLNTPITTTKFCMN